MTLLEHTYLQLKNAGLVRSAAGFSTQYLGRNSNWYAWQKHAGRDFSVDAAVQCLRSVRSRQALTELERAQRNALVGVAGALLAHLNDVHLIADVL